MKKLLANKPYSMNPKDDYLEIRLYHLPDNQMTPYVTWIYNSSDKGNSSGHYFDELDSAIDDFLERAPNKLRRFLK